MVRPQSADDRALLRWLHRVIAGRVEVREQAARERQHAAGRSGGDGGWFRDGIVTAFRSDPGGSHWELLYNEARTSASTAATAVLDVRDVPREQPDLLIAVHDAHLVLQPPPDVQESIAYACSARDRWPSVVVGISPVGASYLPAQTALRATVAASGHPSVYVDGAPDPDALRIVLARWLHVVIGRDPRRRRPFDDPNPALDTDNSRNGGTR